MTQTIDAHFDGKVIVPDEPVSLKSPQRIRVTIHSHETAWTPQRIASQQSAVDRLLSSAKPAINPPDDAIRRESIYED